MTELSEKPRILIVDDDQKSRLAVRSVIEDLELEVIEAGSGEDALREVLKSEFAMIILDVQMTGINGFETAQIIRERDISSDIPIIFLTGYEHEELQIARGYDLGAVDYMIKPIIPESLRAKVKFSVKYRLELLKAQENEKLKAAKNKLAKSVANLERSNRELDAFAYIASHDLQEPLRGITINANFLLRDFSNPDIAPRLERMVALCERMNKLISDLLFFSRLAQGNDIQLEVIPQKVISRIANGLTEFLEERGGQIRVEGDLPTILSVGAKVEVVFRNLITNALKYNDSKKKTVTVGFMKKLTIKGIRYSNLFFVRDNGIGINESSHEKIFRLFSRLNKESAYGAGTGAGLSFVKKIVEDHGGEIFYAPNPKRGTTFYFSLPLFEVN